MLRSVASVLMVISLCGCVTTGSPTVDGSVPVERLRAQDKSIVIVHTSLHDQQYSSRCDMITATLAQRDESGQFVGGQKVTLKALLDLKQVPSRIELPAGEYGIVELNCVRSPRPVAYRAQIAKRGSIFDGSGATYVRPIAQFKVEPGEVVDIGSLRLPARFGVPRALGAPSGSFMAVVTSIPEVWLKNLAEDEPALYRARVTRQMAAAIRI
jgi:hypothetical protein